MSYISKPLLSASIVGLLLFLTFGVLIPIKPAKYSPLVTPSHVLLSKKDAIAKATAFINTMHNMNIEITLRKNTEPAVVYYSDSAMAGYVNKEGLTEALQKWAAKNPCDTYRVMLDVTQTGKPYRMWIDVHMTSGRIIGFELTENPSLKSRTLKRSVLDNNRTSAMKVHHEATHPLARQKLAVTLLGQLGWDATQLKLDKKSAQQNTVTFHVPTAHVGQAALMIHVQFSGGHLNKAKPQWIVPATYKAELLRQQSTMSTLYDLGFKWTSILLGILSLIACIVYRRHIRFGSKTVIILSLVSCSISLMHTWNMLPSFLLLKLQKSPDQVNMKWLLAIQVVVTGLILYFSFLAGKRLWGVSRYKELLPTWRQMEFGDKLTRSFWVGTIYAGILLGIQTIIFFILEIVFHAWSTTEPLQSPINLRITPLFPLLAWTAAIWEEGIYRFFGVGLLQRWLRNPWAAGIISTLIWGLGHLTYPIFPYFSRLIELMFIGMFLLFIMLKYNWWTAMFAHLMFNTLLMSLSLLLNGTIGGMVTGTLYLILPAVITHALAKLHRTRKSLPRVMI